MITLELFKIGYLAVFFEVHVLVDNVLIFNHFINVHFRGFRSFNLMINFL